MKPPSEPQVNHVRPMTWIARYGAAFIFAGVAILARHLLTPTWGSDVKLIMFVPPVLLAAWVGGAGAGLLATGLCGIAAMFLWLSPADSFVIADTEEVFGLLAFLLVGTLTSAIISRLQRARQRIEVESTHLAALALERTKLIEAERAARAAAEAANQEKDHFLAMVAHELRNPLSAIASAAHVLWLARTPAESRHPQAIIVRQTAILGRMVEDLLDISRAERNDIALQREPIDLDDAVRRCVGTLKDAGRLERHVVRIDSEQVWIDADAVRIEQVAVNIIGNAVKYTPAGGAIHITVSREGSAAVFRVRDTGAGIAADFLPRIFDLFARGEREADREAGGLGIGLALVRRMVERHGGDVEVSSEGPNRGSTFTVRLPALAAAGAPASDEIAHSAR